MHRSNLCRLLLPLCFQRQIEAMNREHAEELMRLQSNFATLQEMHRQEMDRVMREVQDQVTVAQNSTGLSATGHLL